MTDRAKLEKETEYVEDLPGFKEGNPHYFKDPMFDRLLEIVLLMGGELWAVKNRQAVMEHLLATHARVSPDMIETFRPDQDFKMKLAHDRQRLIRTIFGNLYEGELPDPSTRYFNWVTRADSKKSPEA